MNKFLAVTTLVVSAGQSPARQLLRRRFLSVVDDEAEATCAPKLETYYACDGGVEDVLVEDERDSYYYSDDDDFCRAIAEIECSVVGDKCREEYESALSCYSEAACDSSFLCVETSPASPVANVPVVAFYNVNPAHSEVCFDYGTTPRMASKSGPVEFGETVVVDIDEAITSVDGIAYDLFVRVSDSCEGGTAYTSDTIAAEIFSSSSNIVGWSVSSSTSQEGFLQSLRRNDGGPTAYFLNEYSDVSDCVFLWGETTTTTDPVSLHEAEIVDLTCSDLEDIDEVAVDCGAGTAATLEVVLDEVCADTSLHFVATRTSEQGNDLTLRLFQAADKESCERTCSSSEKKKKKDDDLENISTMAIILGILLVVLMLICCCVCHLCKQSAKLKKRKQDAVEKPEADFSRTSSL